VFPATSWTLIRKAGDNDRESLDRFARSYERPIRAYLGKRGFTGADQDDLCQDVFLRLLKAGSLGRATAERGRFRSYLLATVVHVVQDRLRKKPEAPESEVEPRTADPDFDREWAFELTTRAFERLEKEHPGYHETLRAHMDERETDRQKLWIARGRLAALIRKEIALTCASEHDYEEEVELLDSLVGGIREARKKD